MNIMDLLERFVAAQEKQAEAAMMMAQQPGGGCGQSNDLVGYGVSGSSATMAGGKLAPQSPTGAWNPYTEKIQGRYGKDKIETLDAALKARGIELKASATGAEKHQALLDFGSKDVAEETVTEEPVTEEPVTEEPVTEETTTPAEGPATIDDVRALAQEAVKGGMTPAQVQDIFEGVGGSRRLPEIKEEHMPAVFAKLTTALKAAVKKG